MKTKNSRKQQTTSGELPEEKFDLKVEEFLLLQLMFLNSGRLLQYCMYCAAGFIPTK